MDMKATIYLRVASGLTLIHAVLHTIGGVLSKPDPGAAAMVVATMQANRFPVMGVMRSYADFYLGMGLSVTILLTMEAVVFWLLASLIKTNGVRLRPILAVFLVGYVAFAVNSFMYFFYAPVLVELLIAASMGMAIATAKPVAAQEPITARA
jgi:D-alanyl-lipoteichoic acid acyltransferase DltB (MBOAT superfamily)